MAEFILYGMFLAAVICAGITYWSDTHGPTPKL